MRTAAISRPVRWVGIVAGAAVALGGIGWLASRDQAPTTATAPPAPDGPPAHMGPAQTYDQLLSQANATFAARQQRATDAPGDWLLQEMYARAAFARARLTGNYDDYAASQAALDRAFPLAVTGAGPHMSQAVLHLMMHRLGPAEQMLEAASHYAVPPDRGERAEILGMRGDIAFYRGDYAGALRLYDEADALVPHASAFRRAVYLSKTGHADLAAQSFEAYERNAGRIDRHMRANLRLQRGILQLDSGHWREALALFREADQLFPGWWLVHEHIAEVTALLGDTAEAERLYRGIIERTGEPEFMDALGTLLLARGETAEAEQWRRRGRAIWERRLHQFPEATYGHALLHCRHYRDFGCALNLAQRNVAARPYGEAQEELAAVLMDMGRAAEARAIIDPVIASAWRTAPTYATAHRIHRALGLPDAAQLAAEARRLNPHIALD